LLIAVRALHQARLQPTEHGSSLLDRAFMLITLPHGTHTAACRQAEHGSGHRPPHGWPLLQLRAGDAPHLDGFVPGDNTPDMRALHVAPLFLVVMKWTRPCADRLQ